MQGRLLRTSVLPAIALLTGMAFLGSAVRAEAQDQLNFGLGVHSPTGETGRTFPNITSGEGDWFFDITITGNVNYLVLSIRDSNPGDFCWFWSKKRPQGRLLFTAEDISAAELDACPGNQYPDINGEPLVFFASFLGSKKAGAIITVTYPSPP